MEKLKLKIGDFDIAERCLKSVALYPELSAVEFTGVFVGMHETKAGEALRYLSEMRAIPYAAEDVHGVTCAGVCDMKDLKLAGGSMTIRFSGRLVRPFQD